jgi:hypothetical protein
MISGKCMIDFDEIKKYLPKYLSPEATEKLFQDLKDFPENIHKRLYGDVLENENDVFQGDGIVDLPVVNLPDEIVRNGKVMILSNTCDISLDNKRIFFPRIMYCPILRLSKFIEMLRKRGITNERINQFVNVIKKQEVSSIFYLPQGGNLEEDYIAILENVNNCDIKVIQKEEIKKRRLFSLSNYGFYLFLFKLSIHFTRIREAVERG